MVMKMIKFFYNGLKVDGGKLQKASYSKYEARSTGALSLAIYKDGYCPFEGVSGYFDVENETDSMTDYFCRDSITITENHPLWDDVNAAWEKQKAHRDNVNDKRTAKRAAITKEWEAKKAKQAKIQLAIQQRAALRDFQPNQTH